MSRNSNRKRPWERGIDRRPSAHTGFGSTNHHFRSQQDEEDDSQEEDVPFVEVDGIKYHSDRFYLNAPSSPSSSSSESGSSATTNNSTPSPSSSLPSMAKSRSCYTERPPFSKCTCGANDKQPRPPPPLFDRAKLISSLNLVAAIVGTYTLDPEYMRREMPTLFPRPNARQNHVHDDDGGRQGEKKTKAVPTLVLHGHKGLHYQYRQLSSRLNKEKDERRCCRRENDPTTNMNKVTPPKKKKRDKKNNDLLSPTYYTLSLLSTRNRQHHTVSCANDARTTTVVINGRTEKQIVDHTKMKNNEKTASFRVTVKRESFDNHGMKDVDVFHIQDDDDSCGGSGEIQNDLIATPLFQTENEDITDGDYDGNSKNETDPNNNGDMKERKDRTRIDEKNDSNHRLCFNPMVHSHHPTEHDDGDGAARDKMNDESDASTTTTAMDDETLPSKPKAKVKAEEEDIPPEEGWMKLLSQDKSFNNDKKDDTNYTDVPLFADTVHLTEILPKWVPPTSSDEEDTDLDESMGSLSTGIYSSIRNHSLQLHGSDENDCTSSPRHCEYTKRVTPQNTNTANDDVITIDDSSDDENEDNNNNNRCDNQPTSTTKTKTIAETSDHRGVDRNTVKRRKSCRGVHHPKFFILFERSGSIVVVISTSNLTNPTKSADASWMQRFEPASSRQGTARNDKCDGDDDDTVHDAMRHDMSDFGYVLTNFLQCQSDAAQVGHLLPIEFLQRYLTISSLQEFRRCYQFHKSQVHLIATVPGERLGRHGMKHLGLSEMPRPRSTGPITTIVKPGCGKMDVKKTKQKRRSRTYLYGPQRVADIVSRLQKPCFASDNNKTTRSYRNSKSFNGVCTNVIDNTTQPKKKKKNPWFPPYLLSNQDRLLIQTTSFGGNWTRANLEEIARLYLGLDDRSVDTGGGDGAMRLHERQRRRQQQHQQQQQRGGTMQSDTHDDLLELIDIVWPSQQYMNETYTQCPNSGDMKNRTQSSLSTLNPDPAANDGDNPNARLDGLGHFCFLSSDSFNTIDLSCISRMVLYEPSTPSQISAESTKLSPHIKTFGRLLAPPDPSGKTRVSPSRRGYRGGETSREPNVTVNQAEECFAWFMLTSACLSRGAQGKAVPLRGYESDAMAYANFELGVLFCSRIQGDPRTDRLYCWNPRRCRCDDDDDRNALNIVRARSGGGYHRDLHSRHGRRGGGGNMTDSVRLIHLPIPYKLRPSSYQTDPEEADMCHTPFFHEIPDGTGGIGQMRLTPLGKTLASRHI